MPADSVAAFLNSSAASASWPLDFAGLGQWKARRLAIVADRLDLVGRHACRRRAQHDDDFARRLRLHLALDPAADRLLERRPGDQVDIVGARPAYRPINHERRQTASMAINDRAGIVESTCHFPILIFHLSLASNP